MKDIIIVERNHAITYNASIWLSIHFNVCERHIHFVMYDNIKYTFSQNISYFIYIYIQKKIIGTRFEWEILFEVSTVSIVLINARGYFLEM